MGRLYKILHVAMGWVCEEEETNKLFCREDLLASRHDVHCQKTHRIRETQTTSSEWRLNSTHSVPA